MEGDGVSRRHFFYGALLAGAVPRGGFGSTPSLKLLGYKSPNEKLNIAAIGAGGKGASDIAGCQGENIVAMADPDSKRAEKTFAAFPKVPKYTDFRRMFDKESAGIDAVLVSCPDHVHASAAMWAMERGKHVYCQKPLTRTVWEAHQLALAAAKYKVATQMGNQGYSQPGARECAEIIWNGDIGDVHEVHAWTNRPDPYWPQGPDVVPEEKAVPSTLDWEAWLAGSLMRPYSPAYVPHNWRGFPDFGCGAIGDMACHILGTPNMALRLNAPTSVECIKVEGKAKYTFPYRTAIRFDFPARGAMPRVHLTWYDGGLKPERPPELEEDQHLNREGLLFVGDKGTILCGFMGELPRLIPASKMNAFTPPPKTLPRSPGHNREWLDACQGAKTVPGANFEYEAKVTETILLGNVAQRAGRKLAWDAPALRASNVASADKLIQPEYRSGWAL